MRAINKWVRLAIAILYFIIICILFFLPGSAFPTEDWMRKIYFDKWVHIGIFSLLIIIWSWALKLDKKQMFVLLAVAVVYGILVEVVQDQFVVNRSFDLTDWAADIAGSGAGLWFWRWYKKNRPL